MKDSKGDYLLWPPEACLYFSSAGGMYFRPSLLTIAPAQRKIMLAHIEPFTTRSHEMGQDYRLRVQSLCNYMEEAAGQHASLLDVGFEDMAAAGRTWVLAKMRIAFYDMPVAGEKVHIATWPVSADRLQCRRDFALKTAAGDVLAAAVTQWVVMNLATRRPEKVAQLGSLQEAMWDHHALEDGDIRIPVVANAVEGPVFPVRLADIDQNNHVNNVRYVDFLQEAAAMFGTTGSLRQLDILFRAEGLRGDVITSHTVQEEGENALLHSLRRKSDGQELARARTIYG